MEAALRWAITSAIQTPVATPAPVRGPDHPVVRDRQPHPGSSGFIEAPPRTQRPRYLSASYPDSVRPGHRFSLEAAVTLSHGAGRTEQLMRQFEVGPDGKQLLLTISAPTMTVHGEHQQPIFVPADADSEPVRFDLESEAAGFQRIRLRAWDGGSCVGELWAEVTVTDRGPSGRGRTSTGRIEAEAIPGEITLEVSDDVVNGQHRYRFKLRDPLTEPAPVYLPLGDDPAHDVRALISHLDSLAERPYSYSSGQVIRALRQEGMDLWQKLVRLLYVSSSGHVRAALASSPFSLRMMPFHGNCSIQRTEAMTRASWSLRASRSPGASTGARDRHCCHGARPGLSCKRGAPRGQKLKSAS